MRTLVLMRHAKSDYPAGVEDFGRPLSERGRREAPLAGDWLTSNVWPIDYALVSAATRTRETWQLVSKQLPIVPEMSFDDRIYEASEIALVDVIRRAPVDAQTLLVIGHNPGLEDLVEFLAVPTSRLLPEVQKKFPTSAIAVLAVTTSWNELAEHSSELTNFAIPRP